jgi:hypothetical protein
MMGDKELEILEDEIRSQWTHSSLHPSDFLKLLAEVRRLRAEVERLKAENTRLRTAGEILADAARRGESFIWSAVEAATEREGADPAQHGVIRVLGTARRAWKVATQSSPPEPEPLP